MLRTLLLLAVIGLGWQDTSKQKQASASTAGGKASHAQKVVPPPSTIENPAISSPQAQPTSTEKQQTSESKPLPWFLRPEWVIVWVTLIYTFLTYFTLRAIKRQGDLMEEQLKDARKDAAAANKTTEATLAALEQQAQSLRYQTTHLKTAAEAALLSAQSHITAERPWIVAGFTKSQEDYIPDDGSVRFKWEINNVGRTPAKLTFAAARVIFNIDKVPMPETPDYGELDYWFTERIIVPGGSLTFLSHWYEMVDGKYQRLYQVEDVEALDLLVGFGCVKYRDTFTGEEEYVTRFCDESTIAGRKVDYPFSPWMDAPAEYTDCT